MKNLLAILTASFLCMNSTLSHGIGGHLYRPESEHSLPRERQTSPSGKSFEPATEQEVRWWGASLSTGWTSREIHYGVDETGNYGGHDCVERKRPGQRGLGKRGSDPYLIKQMPK
jgi:hypothetical protein